MKKVEQRTILIVEDDETLRRTLVTYFSAANTVYQAKNFEQAAECIAKTTFDMILLDLILPDGNGLELFQKISVETPVVILSDLGSDACILEGLEVGALDYIVKPASPEVIEAKMALRLLPPQEAVLSSGGLTADMKRRTVHYNGQPIALTTNEFNTLVFLMRNEGKAFSANEIYEKVWGAPHLNTKTVRVHLHNLRKKMYQISDECGGLILSEFGVGYLFRGGKK